MFLKRLQKTSNNLRKIFISLVDSRELQQLQESLKIFISLADVVELPQVKKNHLVPSDT